MEAAPRYKLPVHCLQLTMLTRGGRGDSDNFPQKAKWHEEIFFFAQVELIMHRSGDEDEDAEPENCAAPLTCKEKVFKENRNFTFLLCFRICSDITTTFTMGSRPSMWRGWAKNGSRGLWTLSQSKLCGLVWISWQTNCALGRCRRTSARSSGSTRRSRRTTPSPSRSRWWTSSSRSRRSTRTRGFWTRTTRLRWRSSWPPCRRRGRSCTGARRGISPIISILSTSACFRRRWFALISPFWFSLSFHQRLYCRPFGTSLLSIWDWSMCRSWSRDQRLRCSRSKTLSTRFYYGCYWFTGCHYIKET